MLLCDVNVLVHAFEDTSPRHLEYRVWLLSHLRGVEPVGLCDPTVAGFLRVVTHPAIFTEPATWGEAVAFVEALRDSPAYLPVAPGERHWATVRDLGHRVGARGNLVPDAWLAATAMANGATLVTTDRGFARFPGLRHVHPLEDAA
ncbi:MAG: TA system VapC family ribonuclease toxin [Kineosporiaceae bacterium]